MTTRIFKQLGQAFGAEPVTLTVKIDGATIYNGTVPTLNLPGVPAVGEETTEVLFQWERDVNYWGVQKLEIAVSGGAVRCERLVANHVMVPSPYSVPSLVPGGSRQYGPFYKHDTEFGASTDPKSNAKINGQAQPRTYSANTLGEWFYIIGDGEVFTCDISTWPGTELYTWDAAKVYQEQAIVNHNDVLYFSKTAVPANTDITNTSFWVSLPVQSWSSDRSWGAAVTVSHEGRMFTSRFAVPRGTNIEDHNYWNRYDDDLATLGNYTLNDWTPQQQ